MASYNVRLYMDTGFSPENIPDNVSLLNSSEIQHIDIDPIWVYQNQERTTIRIKAEFDSIYPVDYCRLGTGIPGHSTIAYYFVTGINMLNPHTAQLNLEIDAITTIGLDNITDNLVGGWCIRRHVNNDTLFSNNIQEDFIPAEPLQLDFKPFKSIPNSKLIIASSVDLDNTDFIANTFMDAENNLSVTVPQMPSITQGTIIRIYPGGRENTSDTYQKTLPNIRLYDYSRNPERYNKSLSILWSLGMIDSITSMYNISGSNIIIYVSEDSGGIQSIEFDGTSVSTDSGISITWNYNAKNNKVFCDQFNKINIASFSSGDELDFNPSDIVQPNDTTFQFAYWHDPSPNGKTYLRPKIFQGLNCETDAVFFQCISGSNWPNTQASFNMSENWAVNKKIYDMKQQGLNYEGLFNFFGSLQDGSFDRTFDASQTTNLLNPLTYPEQMINRIEQGLNLNLRKRNNRLNRVADTSLVSPTIKFPRNNTLVDVIGNGFFLIRSRLSDNDSQRFDRYLTEYGYAVNEPLTKDCFYGRQYFNYIEATDINIKKISQVPMRLKQLAIKQIEGGIRIWHTLVNANAFTDNPIVGG